MALFTVSKDWRLGKQYFTSKLGILTCAVVYFGKNIFKLF